MLGNNGQPLCKKIDNYVFKFSDVLGQGNFSKVYKGTHEVTKQTVAIKVIELNSLKSPKLQQLLFSQIDVLKKLNHPNILKCYQVFSSNRNCYIVTEICNEGDLQTKLKAKKQFSQDQAEAYILDVFKGLKYLAENHVIHRDLKIANVFLHNGMAKIADFGFAKFTKQNFQDINIGSPIYMSPEGLLNNVYGPKTDVWAYGIFIYELLHGKTPYSRCNSESDLKREIQIPIQYTSMKNTLSFDLRQVIIKCLETNEEKRVGIPELQQISYFKNLLKKDKETIPLGGSRKTLLNTPARRNAKPASIEHFSQQKNRYNIKGFHPEKLEFHLNHQKNPLVLEQPAKNNHRNQIKSPYSSSNRPYSAQKRILYSDFKQKADLNLINKNSGLGSPMKLKVQNDQKKMLFNSESIKPNSLRKPMKNSGMVCVLPGFLNFKESVNAVHYCRLLYKFSMMGRQTDEELKDHKFIKIVSAWMFKILSQIIQKIEKKEVVYDDQTNRKQTKLREVTSQYYKKYSTEIEKPFEMDTSFDIIISQATNKLQQYDKMQLYRSEMASLLHLAYFLVIILESTILLKRCSVELRFWEWGQNKEVQQFLGLTLSNLSYQKYLQARRRVLQ